MDRNSIENILYGIIAQNCDEIPGIEEMHGKSIIEDLGLDSVTLMQIVAEVEERFAVSLEESGSLLELLDDFDELTDYLVSESEAAHE